MSAGANISTRYQVGCERGREWSEMGTCNTVTHDNAWCYTRCPCSSVELNSQFWLLFPAHLLKMLSVFSFLS
jgi:hypothetical protein